MRFTILQRRILSVLEEAGQDYLAALMNTIAVCRGTASEIKSMSIAIAGLVDAGLIEIAWFGIETGSEVLSRADALKLSAELQRFLNWSEESRLWQWKGTPIAEILLTPSGIPLATRILMEDGWPTAPLPSFESPRTEQN